MTAHAPVSMADPDLCHEGRRLTAAAFLARMRGVAPLLGVTRLGRLTGLDRQLPLDPRPGVVPPYE